MTANAPSAAARLVVGLFRLWQRTGSVLAGPSCRFVPSCSHYGIEAVRRHGVATGLRLTATRLLRCHPWGGRGFDPVPEHIRPVFSHRNRVSK
jgi:putative membrane protein insertion efficiency factor